MFDSIVGMKYFNVYGPNEEHKGDMRRWLAKHIEISETKKMSLFKSYHPNYLDGEQKRLCKRCCPNDNLVNAKL